jgi:uncharacterized membrane protein
MKYRFPVPYLIYILVLSLAVINFCIPQKDYPDFQLKDYLKAAILIFLCIMLIIAEGQIIIRSFKGAGEAGFLYAAIVLFPMAFLFLWNPAWIKLPPALPILIIIFTQYCFWSILSDNKGYLALCRNHKKIILLFSGLYLIFFIFMAFRQYIFFSNFNPKDFAIYNQTFWNTIHGRIFQNTAYGSNFSCHNSPFFFLLIPFYYLFPHPLSLQAIKTILLASSVIPFYLIIRQIISEERAILPLALAFLLFPHLLSQNFTAPHEITYAPFFILFTYYFYQRRKFLLYILFLLIVLSIKEHLALVAVMFGIHSLWSKRSRRWSVLSITLGIMWGLFSVWVINYFQRIYNSHIDAAWFILDFKRRFLQGRGNPFIFALSSNDFLQWYGLKKLSLFIVCAGIIPPFLSTVTLLGIPELIIAFISNRLVMLDAHWHYMIVFSCFLLVGSVYGIVKVSEWFRTQRLWLSPGKIQALLSVFILSMTLMHSYMWMDLTGINKTKDYVLAVKKALTYVPSNAFITVPREIAPFVSSREKYNIIDEAPSVYGEYVLINQSASSQRFATENQIGDYLIIFDSPAIKLFRRIPRQPI